MMIATMVIPIQKRPGPPPSLAIIFFILVFMFFSVAAPLGRTANDFSYLDAARLCVAYL